MLQRVLSNNVLAKALRMVLVFALVFWSSFRVECLAFAAVNVDGQLEQHEDNNDKLRNVEVWQVSDPALGADDDSVLVTKARDVKGTFEGTEQAATLRVNARSSLNDVGSLSFVAIPVWNEGEADEFTVTYTDGVADEEVFADQKTEHLKKGDPTPGFDGEPKRDGYAFDGWDPSVAETVTEDVTYKAKWKENGSEDKKSFTVTFLDENGNVIESYEVEEGKETPSPEASRAGYSFAGWNPALAETVTEDATYTATWEANTYLISFVDSDGSSLADYEQAYGTATTIPEVSREGYVFAGWSPEVAEVVTDNAIYTATWEVDPEEEARRQAEEEEAARQAAEEEARRQAEEEAARQAEEEAARQAEEAARQAEEEAARQAAEEEARRQAEEEQAQSEEDAENRPSPRPEIATQAEHDLTIANFMEWQVEGPAEITVDERGVATLKGTSSGKAVVTCYPNERALALVDDELDYKADFKLTFEVQVVYVSSLELYSVKSDELVGGSVGDPAGTKEHPLELADDERSNFAIKAVANVSDGLTDDEAVKFTSTSEQGLSKASDGLLSDLAWAVLDEEGNEVDPEVALIENGVLRVVTPDPVTLAVRCTTADGENGDYSEYVYVTTGEAPDEKVEYQGADHHQDTLTVTVQRPKVVLETSNGQIGDEASDTQHDQQPEGAEGEEAQAYDEALATYDAELVNTETGKQLDINEKEYSMTLPVTRNGVESPESVVASGRGTTLALLLDDAGIGLEEQKDIEYIEFGNVEAKSTRVMWADLVNASHAEASYIMVAKQAYVHEPPSSASSSSASADPAPVGTMAEGDEDETPAETSDAPETPEAPEAPATPEAPEGAEQNPGGSSSAASPADPWLGNTRFQIMFDQSDAAPALTDQMSDLRWVNSITVHMKGAEAPEYVDGLRPRIAYDPVPEGVTALLTAVPPSSIGGANFGYKWERSTDEGRTWSEVSNNTQQTIHVPTDDEHIGNYYRVSVIIDDGDSEPSRAVQIQIGDGLVVQLDYIPPYAGDWANFTSHVIGADENDPNIQYRWEQSTDGCNTWSEIPNETAKTLRVRTNPITASDSGDEADSGPATLTYVRVVAVLGSQSGVSGPQLLTVRVGDNSKGADSYDQDGNEVETDDPKVDELEDLLNQDDDEYVDDFEEDDDFYDDYYEPQQTHITPLEIDYEDEDTDYEEEEDEPVEQDPILLDEVPAAEPVEAEPVATDISKVIVDDEVSQKIREQNRQKKEASEATPGARWTEISPMNASRDDVRRVLAGNPFAPFAGPMALGFTAAGVVEKLLAFRRQIR